MACLGIDTPLKFGIFLSFVCLWTASNLLVYGSQLKGARRYNAASVVMLTEFTKLIMAITMYRTKDGSVTDMKVATVGNWLLFVKYAVPAVLYCAVNYLSYKNLTQFDPGTYNVLMQLKIVGTGLCFQVMFNKRLHQYQWLAVLLITFGCMCKEGDKLTDTWDVVLKTNAWAWLQLFCQVACSVLAGVYTEALLKNDESPMVALATTNLQNVHI